jgi:hypothetical protein
VRNIDQSGRLLHAAGRRFLVICFGVILKGNPSAAPCHHKELLDEHLDWDVAHALLQQQPGIQKEKIKKAVSSDSTHQIKCQMREFNKEKVYCGSNQLETRRFCFRGNNQQDGNYELRVQRL